MEKISLLDCTLRDGGYINDWNFGKKSIRKMIEKLTDTNVEIFELGFLKNEPYNEDRTVFNSMKQVKAQIAPKKPGVLYAMMCEVVSPLPLDMLAPADADSADIIRVIIWKTKHDQNGNVVDALEEGYRYCKGIVEKGYKLCVQPARVDQYSDEEFAAMVRRFSELNPMAIYVVDSWGTQNAQSLLHYMHLAEQNMPADIALGYHGHNNMMQALGVAQVMVKEDFHNNIIIDASVYGIGRGAGNLNLEIISKYLNEEYAKHYNISPMLDVNDDFIQDIYKIEQWGYSIPYFLTAKYNCNPSYAAYLSSAYALETVNLEKVLGSLSECEKIIFTRKDADNYVARFFSDLLIIILSFDYKQTDSMLSYHLSADNRTTPIFVLDAHGDIRTESVIKNYNADGWKNVQYFARTDIENWKKMFDIGYTLADGKFKYILFSTDNRAFNYCSVKKQIQKAIYSGYPLISIQIQQTKHEDTDAMSLEAAYMNEYDYFSEPGRLIMKAELLKQLLSVSENRVQTTDRHWLAESLFEVQVNAKKKIEIGVIDCADWYWANNWKSLAPWETCWVQIWANDWERSYHIVVDKNDKLMGCKFSKINPTPYSPRLFLTLRATGNLNARDVRKNKEAIIHKCVGKYQIMLCISILPKAWTRFLYMHPYSLLFKCIRKISKIQKGAKQ